MSNVSVLVGDLFACNTQVLANAINAVGVMGKDTAFAFKYISVELYARSDSARFQLVELLLAIGSEER